MSIQSFTGVGGQQSSVARMNRRKSGSQVRVLSRGGSSLSVTSTNSNSSTHSYLLLWHFEYI